jgi:DNA-binding NtrC family response regulator
MSPAAPDPRDCPGLTVLLVDDEPSFRLSLAEGLRDDGHQVLDYPSGTAVPPFATLPPTAILVTDFEMPGSNGLHLADGFRRAHPNGHAILLSAYTIPAVDGAVAARPWLRFVSKPVDYETLHALIHHR